MQITLDEGYNAMCDFVYLGYVGEVNARQISVLNYAIPEATAYKLKIEYPDKTVYEIPIKNGMCSLGASIFKTACEVKCQIIAYAVEGEVYKLVRKSDIFKQEIRSSIDETGIPSYEESLDALDKILQYESNSKEYAERAEAAAIKSEESESKSTLSALNASKSETAAAGYAKTAKTNADSTAADRQAVQTLAEQVTADKTIVVDNAAKVAEDRTAAETAAQTAQSIADSLPDDYVTAVGKIAENTAEIANVKLTDKELKRRVDALYSIGQGITHQFETDTDTAYTKAVPTGAKLMSVKSVGGKSIVWNQLVQPTSNEITGAGVKVTFSDDGIITLNGTATTTGNAVSVQSVKNQKGHKYLLRANPLSGVYGVKQLLFSSQGYGDDQTGRGVIITNGSSNAKWYYTLYLYNGVTYDNVKLQPQIYDLTLMLGSGNEPTSVEEFEKMFPADYYPYNEGELMSMSVNNVVEQGKNLFDCYGFSCIAILNVNGERKLNNSYGTTISTIEPTNKIVVTQSQAPESVIAHSNNGWFCVGIKGMEQSKRYTFSFDFTATKMLIQNPVLQILVNGRFPEDAINISELNVKKRVSFTLEYTKVDDRQYIELRLSGMSGIFENFQLDEGSTATAYTPYYTPISYTIPQAIRNLPGYGVEENVVDYEAKTYTQNNTIDGTEVKALDTPIITDISSLIPDDFLRNMEVEAGGSVTFKGGNDDYRIPVPSEEEYIVKLSEVGGTT